jgi:hypothetical protein
MDEGTVDQTCSHAEAKQRNRKGSESLNRIDAAEVLSLIADEAFKT